MALKFIMMDHLTLELVIPWNWALGDRGVGRCWSCPVWEKSKMGGKMNVVYEKHYIIRAKPILNC
jgi:hypothetical protein